MSRLEKLLDSLEELAAVVTLPVGILAAWFIGWEVAGVVFVVGWLLLVPGLSVLADNIETGTDKENETASETPLEELKRRYANGEIDEYEFEQRLERLVALDEIPESAVETATTDGTATSEERESIRET